MRSIDETILRTTKEITVKFIEMGRVSPVTFSENFINIYQTVSETVRREQTSQPESNEKPTASDKK